MTYSILLTNGTTLVPGGLANATINQTTTDLTLIGQNTSGYGTYINQNFVKLLENFANTSQPNHPLKGQLWYDTSQNLLQIYNGKQFTPTGNTIVADSAPSGLTTGGLWINSKTSQLYFNDGTQTTLAGPAYTRQQGLSGFIVSSVLDTLNVSHTIVSLYVANTLMGIFAKESFVPASAITGFTDTVTIKAYQTRTILTVESASANTLIVGQTITGDGVLPNTIITSLTVNGVTANGGVGQYLVSTNAIVTSTTMTAVYGTLQIGFNVSTYGGIKFNVPVSQANYLLSPTDGSLKNANSFLSTTSASQTTGTISIANSAVDSVWSTPQLVLGQSGYTQINTTYSAFEIKSKIANQDFQVTLNPANNATQAFYINGTVLRVGINGFNASNLPQATLDVNGSFRVAPGNVPLHYNSTGVQGQIAWDSGFIYVCIATNTWARAPLTSVSW
jgi:hypothetical protein